MAGTSTQAGLQDSASINDSTGFDFGGWPLEMNDESGIGDEWDLTALLNSSYTHGFGNGLGEHAGNSARYAR